MFRVQFNLLKAYNYVSVRHVLCSTKNLCTNAGKTEFKKTVFISQSNDIFTNLALEDWLYKNYDFTNQHVLMLWRNDPCVVIGRFQNPWLEASVGNLCNITDNGTQLARRNSGGGTVYHDHGNLNLTFFTGREVYNRKHNLELICRAVFREFNIKVDISPREDLVIRNCKISGTASKLGRLNAYHHCTLLVNSNKGDISMALQKNDTGITTNATRSIRSKIMNLCEENPIVTINNLLTAIGWEYMRTPCSSFRDGGMHLAKQQNGFQLINPTEEWFPGLTEIRNGLVSWEWCYGKTPQFTVTQSFPVPVQFLENSEEATSSLTVTMVVEEGKVSDVTLFLPPGLSNTGFSGEANVVTNLKGHKFTEDTIKFLEFSLSDHEYGLTDDKDRFVTECVRQVMTSV